MKKILLICSMLLAATFGYSQYYYLPYELGENPGGINTDNEFPVGGGLPAGWTTIASGPHSGWTNVTIPFDFKFNGTDYTSCKVADGVVTFSASPSSDPGFTAEALPSTKIPDNSICLWGLDVGTGDFLVSKTFGTSPNRQFWIQFNTAKSAGTQDGWYYGSIVLEESTNNIYLVDQRNACRTGTAQCNGKAMLTFGIQIDGSTAVQVTGSPVASKAGESAGPEDNMYYAFMPGSQPDDALLMMNHSLKKDYGKGNIDIAGRIRNTGKKAVTAFDLSYSINGGAPVTQNVMGVNIAAGAYYNFVHGSPWNSTPGTYDVKIWTSMPNGVADGNSMDDSTMATVTVHDAIVQRMPLYEVFTSSTCGPCNPGNANFNSVMDGKWNECVSVKYQQDFPGNGDPYCYSESYSRRGYYGITSIPRMELDGGWDQNANSFTSQLHQQYYDNPAFVDATGTWSVDWMDNVKASVEIDPLADFSGDIRLFVALVEKTTFENKKTNGETEFTNVLKKMLGGTNGVQLGNLTKGTKVTKDVSFDFTGHWILPVNGKQADWVDLTKAHTIEEMSDLAVAFWVQNFTTKEVLQAGWAVDQSTGITELNGDHGIKVYPNPSTGITNVEFDVKNASDFNIEVLNNLGQTVYTKTLGTLSTGLQSNNLDLSNLNNGMYYIKVVTNSGFITKSILLNK